MKTGIRNGLVGLGILTATLIHAQDTNIDWDSASDLQVELQAIEQVPPMPAIDATNGNTFYSAQHAPGTTDPWPPLPGDVPGLSTWDLGDGIYLLDDLGYHYHHRHKASSHSLSGLGAGMSMTADDSPVLPGDDDDTNPPEDSFPTLSGADPINTNLLWLQITNVANEIAYLNLYNATDYVYAVWSTTNLSTPFTDWDIETEVFPSNTNCMPFTVQTQDRQNLFLQAEDWTGVTSDGNTTPDWWFWEYYGATDLSDTNLDSIGSPLLQDYQNNIDPNIIFFTLQFPQQIQTNVVNGSIPLTGGTPSYMAVLVNDANPADAVWEPFTSTNLTLDLDWGDGFYNISVGMKGMARNSTVTWSGVRVEVYRPALTLTVTNPTSATVSQPMIQLQGLANKTLSSLTYDISNALGIVTSQTGYWQGAFYDTNLEIFTTNTFQCYDIPLTNGLNTITLHATDLAGHVTTTNLNYTLDYSSDTNPPALSILWPQNGTLITGNSFTLQGQVDDDTATVMAVMNGQTNAGMVERSGKVWVNNIPMAAGTNILRVTATDAAGNAATTNLTVIQSRVFVMLDPLPTNELNQPDVDVTGSISDTNEDVCITVNGTNAYYLDDLGDWEADNVPVSPTGMATFDIELYTGDPINIGSENLPMAQRAVMGLLTYTSSSYYNGTTPFGCLDSPLSGVSDSTTHWNYPLGGAAVTVVSGLNGDCEPQNTSGGDSLPGGLNGLTPTWEINSYGGSFYNPPYWVNVYFVGPTYIKAFAALGSQSSSANAQIGIFPSGLAVPGQQALYLVQGQVYDEDTGEQIPGSEFQYDNELRGAPVTDVDGISEGLVVAAAGAVPNATPQTSGDISFNDPPPTVTPVTVQLTVISNSATQVDSTDWAVVKTLTNNYVYVQASFSVTNITIPTNAANLISWNGGEPVPGNPLQRMVTTTNSVETTVSASLTGITNSLNMWVIWAMMNIQTGGTNPPNAPSFIPAGESNQLSLVYYSNSNSAAGQICAIATITPAGIHSVITNGWNVFQYRMSHDFDDGQPSVTYFDSTWQTDGPQTDFKTVVPDSGDMLYTIDGPNIASFRNTNSSETYNNFYDYITWNSQICCSTNNFWYFEGRWKANQTPQITFTGLGTGNITLPAIAYYPP